MELPDHSPSRLHRPPSRSRVGNIGRNFGLRGVGAAVQPLGLSSASDDGVPDGLQALQVGGRLELPPQNPLAEDMPLRKEPGPGVEALNLYAPEAVDRGLERSMRRQDCLCHVPRISFGPWDRLVAIKHRYDLTNLFRLNQNIPPAKE